MRLTLRTLLAYLDDTLDPTEAKLIGQKVAESETAKELMERIKQVTRRRRITTPPPAGPGAKIDPNTIAGYLEDTLTPEQLSEVEQVCLASDAHLAEIAACHQILTLVLGEPALVPPTAKQRMYGLVKGPEAIPFRKPPAREYTPEGELADEEADETLRLGLPAFRRGTWSHRVLLAGGGVLVMALLVLAIVQVLGPLGGGPELNVAQGNGQEKKPDPPKPDPIVKPPLKDPIKDPIEGKKPEPEKKTPTKKEPEQPISPPLTVDIPFAPPSPKQVVVGQWQQPAASETSVLLQLVPSRLEEKKSTWSRFSIKKGEVYSGRPLVSLPGCQSTVETGRGVLLTLWGSLPELWPLPPLFESRVDLHAHDQLDLDLTLRRGRIALANKSDKPALVRIRFENPTNPDAREYVDITLLEKNSKVLVDRWNYYPRNEPFFKDANDPERQGPTAEMGFLTLDGHLSLKANDLTVSLQAPAGPAVFLWNSRKGPNGPLTMPKLPEWTSPNPPLPQGVDARARTKMLAARDNLATSLSGKDVDVALTEAKGSPDDNYRRLAVRCYGAVDDLPSLLDALEEKYPEVRTTAIETLRLWSASARDHDAKLFEAVKKKFYDRQPGVWERIMELLHSFSEEQAALPSTYETLIDNLNSRIPVIRELSAWHLYQMVPQGRQIPYLSDADEPARREAQKMWTTLVPPGQLPRQPMATPKSK